jgi:hypothetical protein
MTNFNWNVKLGQVFNITDIDQDLLVELTNEEYKPGEYSSWENTKNGLAAERMLIELCNYTNDARPYKDVFNPDNESVEVKSFGTHRDSYEYKRDTLATLWERKVKWKKDISEHVIFFKRDESAGTYTVDEMFFWDKLNKSWRSEK